MTISRILTTEYLNAYKTVCRSSKNKYTRVELKSKADRMLVNRVNVILCGIVFATVTIERAVKFYLLHFNGTKNIDDLKLVSSEVDTRVQQLAKTMSIHPKVTVIDATESKPGKASASGSNLPFSTPIIRLGINPRLQFVIGHELAHIRHNHQLKSHLTGATIVNLFPVLASKFLKTKVLCRYYIIGVCIQLLTLFCLGRYAERQADLTSCKYLTKHEIAEGISFLDNLRKRNIKHRQQLSKGSLLERVYAILHYSPEGNIRFLDVHPSYTSRIEYLSRVMDA